MPTETYYKMYRCPISKTEFVVLKVLVDVESKREIDADLVEDNLDFESAVALVEKLNQKD